MVLHNFLKRDYAYLVVAASAIAIGTFIRRMHNAQRKRTVSSTVGFLVALLFCGWEVLHSMVSIAIGTILMNSLKSRIMPRVVFAFAFTYRTFFCLLSYYGTWRDESTLANGIQLILTIKLISVAYEIDEYRKHRSNGYTGSSVLNDPSNHKAMLLYEEPTAVDVVCYMYCFLGLCTGPFYRFRTYHDMLRIPKHASNGIPAWTMVVSRIPMLVILIILSTVVGNYFPTDYMRSDEFYESRSFVYRFCYVIPIGIVGMARYGVVWYLSEFSFIVTGLGIYPEAKQSQPGRGPSVFQQKDPIWQIKESPKPVKYDFEAVRNVYIKQGFTSETYAKTFRYWNCTVQWWLAHFIYASALFSGKPSLIRWIAVGFVSALWHGFRAGYYFAFVGMVYIAFAERLLLSNVTSELSGPPKSVFSVLHYFLFKMIGIGTFMGTFALSNYDDVLRYLTSVYFGIYSIATISILLAILSTVTSTHKEHVVLKNKHE